MKLNKITLMSFLATTFRAILAGLQSVIAPISARDRARTDFFVRAANRINRTIQRFESLVARWQSGTLPNPRTTPRPRRATRAEPGAPRLPRGKAWLVRALAHHDGYGRASQLAHFLATPEAAAFLVAVPRAGRLLRPLCNALGITPPDVIAPPPPAHPPPARPPRPAVPRPPRAPPPGGAPAKPRRRAPLRLFSAP